jgi:hypothetical protein
MMDKEKFRVLKKLDVAAARALFRDVATANGFKPAINDTTGKPMSEDEVILASLHKSRLSQPRLFSKAEKAASRKWLYDNHMAVDIK